MKIDHYAYFFFPQVWSKFNSESLRLLELKACKGYGGIKLNIATCLQS